jgi:Fe-S oxidoreductase
MKALFQVPCHLASNNNNTINSVLKVAKHLNIELEILHDFTCCGLPIFENGDFKQAKKIAEHHVKALKDKTIITCNDKCQKTFEKYYPKILNNTVVHNDCMALSENTKSIFEFLPQLKLSKSNDISGQYFFLKDCSNQQIPSILTQFKNVEWHFSEMENTCCGASFGFSCHNPHLSEKMALNILEEMKNKNIDKIITPNDLCLNYIDSMMKKHNITFQIIHLLDFIADAI